MLQLYDSLSKSKHEFKPRNAKEVTLYVCGITPNNATHLGHAFTYVSFDILVRYLTYKGYTVKYLQNATDVNDSDDVIRQANEVGKSWEQIAQLWIHHFHKQMDALHVLRPTKYVLASSVMEQIITMVDDLMQKGFAYEKQGNVYLDVAKLESYGCLSKYQREQMLLISKERGNDPEDPHKRNPLDFVLWLASEGKPNWKSPWSQGRPGWHIECSAMIYKDLGAQIDIHGGGRDLIFPHHESEIAQSESFTEKKPFVTFWMHAGMVMYEGEKMSKSLGNLILVEDLLKHCSPSAIRWNLLSHQYRHPWEYEREELDDCEARITDLRKKLQEPDRGDWSTILRHLDNDLNTPELLRYLAGDCAGQTLRKVLDLLGFEI